MLTKVRQLLSYEFTVAELIGLLMLAAPYLLIGCLVVLRPTPSSCAICTGWISWCPSWVPSCRGRSCCSRTCA